MKPAPFSYAGLRVKLFPAPVIWMVVVMLLWNGRVFSESRQERTWTWDFEADAPGDAPKGFSFGRTGSGRLGRWIVQAEEGAPSGAHVLAQLDTDGTDYRFPVAIADEPVLRDLSLSVKCRPVAGKADQACGLVFRYQDERNYYVARANALEGNVRFYRVVNGRREQLATWSGLVAKGAWHVLLVEVEGDRIELSWDGTKIIEAHDRTFSEAGRIGVWTKADSVTLFDDLRVRQIGDELQIKQ